MSIKSATGKQRCFANIHMTPAEFALWTYAREVSHESGRFYASSRSTAEAFSGTSKSTIDRLKHALIRSGWFVLLSESYRDPETGKWTSDVIRPLSHEKWLVSDAPKSPCKPVPHAGHDDLSNGRDVSHGWDGPVPRAGRSCPTGGTNTAFDSAIDTEKGVGVEESQRTSLEPKTTGNSIRQFYKKLRRSWDAYGSLDYNATPDHLQQAHALALKYGDNEFFFALKYWLKDHAVSECKTKKGYLRFPLVKFLEQESYYFEDAEKVGTSADDHEAVST
jgi:hypothetical protein